MSFFNLKKWLYPENMFFTLRTQEPDLVWYSPDLDDIVVDLKSQGYVFVDEQGEHHLRLSKSFKTHPYYLVGEL